MVLPVSRPQKHPKTSVYYFRQKVPADLRAAFGKAEVSWSLGTKDPQEARALHAEAARKQALVWKAMRAKPEPLFQKVVEALAGSYYHATIQAHENEPGDPAGWDAALDALHERGETEAGRESLHGTDADRLLHEEGLAADADSRSRLLEAMQRACVQAYEQLMRKALGDYRPDPDAGRFPERRAEGVAGAPKDKPTLTGLFALWEREHLANGKSKKTAADFRQKIDSLRAFVEHDDAERVTPENIVAWCDRLRFTDGLSPRTVANKYLVAVKTIFGLACQRKALRSNPAKDYTIKVPKAKQSRPKGFTDTEAAAILSASLASPETLKKRPAHIQRAIRWLPWVCAYTGARVGEVAQLRREDLVTEHGVLCLRITPEAGTVKTGSYRLVPLHPHLIEQGLPEVIRSQPEGPLFFRAGTAGVDPLIQAQSMGKIVGKWVRETVGIVADVQPNHAWRHRFKTLARDVDMDPEYRDAIQGHEDGRAAAAYGENTMKALFREVSKIPRQGVAPASPDDLSEAA